jgi:uncharacterized LabA/DUF88 family protein
LDRVIAYVDGFNLYFGLREKGWRKYYWLNVKLLCENILAGTNRHLVYTKYFTSRIKNNPEKEKRQSTFLDALGTVPDLTIFYGRYKITTRVCQNCLKTNEVPTEKMTDVRIASQMISDAVKNNYDSALLITGDGDLVPAIEVVKEIAPTKKIIIASPPRRPNSDLYNAAGNRLNIFEATIKNSLFPNEVRMPNGFILKCPDYWKT